MPIPQPTKNEERDVYISRCAGSKVMNEDYPDDEMRLGVCYSTWRNSKKDSVDKDDDRNFVFNIDYSSNFRVDPETGFLHARARLTRTGVFDYYDSDGSLIRELRSENEVFDEKSLETLKMKPITFRHPKGFVDTTNIKDLAVGTVGEKIDKIGPFVEGNILITDRETIKDVISNKLKGLPSELSCGYKCKLVPDIGIHDKDGYYTYRQEKIRYNHVGIVEEGRAGRHVRIMDQQGKHFNNNSKESEMANKIQFTRTPINIGTFKIDSMAVVVDEDSLKTINVLNGKIDEAATIIKNINDENETLKGKFDQAQETITNLKKEVEKRSDINSPEIAEMVKKRMDVEKVATSLGVEVEGKDIKTVKCDCIKKVSENATLDEKPDPYIDARFDAIIEIIIEKKKNDGNNKFSNFMDAATKNRHQKKTDARKSFIDKDKEQNRK